MTEAEVWVVIGIFAAITLTVLVIVVVEFISALREKPYPAYEMKRDVPTD